MVIGCGELGTILRGGDRRMSSDWLPGGGATPPLEKWPQAEARAMGQEAAKVTGSREGVECDASGEGRESSAARNAVWSLLRVQDPPRGMWPLHLRSL